MIGPWPPARQDACSSCGHRVCDAANVGDVGHLDLFFADWEHWCSDILESYLSFPAIAYLRSQHPPQELAAVRCELEQVGLRLNRSLEADRQLDRAPSILRAVHRWFVEPFDDAGSALVSRLAGSRQLADNPTSDGGHF